jgi:hypothetical protein
MFQLLILTIENNFINAIDLTIALDLNPITTHRTESIYGL